MSAVSRRTYWGYILPWRRCLEVLEQSRWPFVSKELQSILSLSNGMSLKIQCFESQTCCHKFFQSAFCVPVGMCFDVHYVTFGGWECESLILSEVIPHLHLLLGDDHASRERHCISGIKLSLRKYQKVYFKVLLFCTHLGWCSNYLWRPGCCRECCCMLQQCVNVWHIVTLNPGFESIVVNLSSPEGGVNCGLFTVNYALYTWRPTSLCFLALGHPSKSA